MDSSGRFYVNYSNSYRIKVFSAEGELEREIRREGSMVKITPAEMALMRAKYGGPASEFLGQIPFPKVKPPVNGLYMVEDFLFVRKTRIDNRTSYDIYDRNLEYFGTLVLEFVPFLSRNRRVYTFDRGGELSTGQVNQTQLIRYAVHFE